MSCIPIAASATIDQGRRHRFVTRVEVAANGEEYRADGE